MSFQSRCMSKISAASFAAAALFASAALYAAEIRGITITGNTIDLDFARLFEGREGDLSRKDMEALGALVTDEYHRRGFTTTFVEKLIVRADGFLEIQVRESRMLDISVSGARRASSHAIARFLLPEKGELYNRNVMRDRIRSARERFNLENVRISPLNYRDTPDVFLSVEVEEKARGHVFGAIGIDPIYGLSPVLGYMVPLKDAALTCEGRAGYSDGGFRRLEGGLKYARQAGEGNGPGFIGSLSGGRLVEIWSSRDIEYSDSHVTSSAGAGLVLNAGRRYLLWTNIYAQGGYHRLEDYRNAVIDGYDVRFVADTLLSDKYYLLDRRNATELNLAAWTGIGNLEGKGYVSTEVDFVTAILPVSWLRLVPRLHAYYTSSGERFYWKYVFDKYLLGFPGDYTASGMKNTLGFEVQFELASGYLFLGALANAGLYRGEEGTWSHATGVGLKATVILSETLIELAYAWDAYVGPKKGGFYVSAEVSF
jgi:hypothetical protein